MIVGDEVEDVFLQVRPGAGDCVHSILPDHLSERDAELGCAHRACDRHEHFATAVEVRAVGVSGIYQCRGVEVTKVVTEEV